VRKRTVFIWFLPLVNNSRRTASDVQLNRTEELNRLQRDAGSDRVRMYVTHCLHGDFGSFTFH